MLPFETCFWFFVEGFLKLFICFRPSTTLPQFKPLRWMFPYSKSREKEKG